jgi:hypothetical protein
MVGATKGMALGYSQGNGPGVQPREWPWGTAKGMALGYNQGNGPGVQPREWPWGTAKGMADCVKTRVKTVILSEAKDLIKDYSLRSERHRT